MQYEILGCRTDQKQYEAETHNIYTSSLARERSIGEGPISVIQERRRSVIVRKVRWLWIDLIARVPAAFKPGPQRR